MSADHWSGGRGGLDKNRDSRAALIIPAKLATATRLRGGRGTRSGRSLACRTERLESYRYVPFRWLRSAHNELWHKRNVLVLVIAVMCLRQKK